MSRENLEKVSNGYDAARRKDIPAVLALFSPDVEIYQSGELPWGGDYRGRDGAKRFFAVLLDHIEAIFQPQELVDAGDVVVAFGTSRGRVRATGAEFEVPTVHLWRFQNGQVARFEAYVDVPIMRHALFG